MKPQHVAVLTGLTLLTVALAAVDWRLAAGVLGVLAIWVGLVWDDET